jgi:branched-chain amino acid transport system substrate-binding protein
MTRDTTVARRDFLRIASGAAAIVGLEGLRPALAQGAKGRPIKIGYVTPQTGPLASFGEAGSFVVSDVQRALGEGLVIKGRTHPVEILVGDSQSEQPRAAEVATKLIQSDHVDMMLAASTPETTIPVANQCESSGTPAISTITPWQPWFFARGGKRDVGFKSTFHFFHGLEEIAGVFIDMWNAVETNKVVGALWPGDSFGKAWANDKLGFPPVLASNGYRLVDPGRFANMTSDFSEQIALFKSEHVEIVTGIPLAPDWATFWKQAAAQDFRPKAVSLGRATLFPRSVEALGDLGDGISIEAWWTPQHPFRSSLTGSTSAAFAAAYTRETHRQWTLPLGFIHALFEVALDAFKRAESLDDKGAIVAAIKATDLTTLVGPISWGKGPVPNVTKTPLVGGQWGRGKDFRYDLTIVSNRMAQAIPASGPVRPLRQA